VVLHNLLMIFLLIRHQQARSAILLSFQRKSTGFVKFFSDKPKLKSNLKISFEILTIQPTY
ncbi:hypothetical protein B9T24_05845, partial [Acinetobacter sp. ANC 4654]